MSKWGKAICCLCCCLLVILAGAALADTASDQAKGINHRGYNTVAPENTIPAYELSIEKGFRYVETDVSFTKDLVPVLLHDGEINRTARNADGSRLEKMISINDITYEEALAYDFGIWKGEKYKGTKIPTFEAFLQLCKENGLHPYIELKQNGDYTRDQINGLVKMVSEKGLQGKVTWISFTVDYLRWVRDQDPKARLGLLETLWFSQEDFRKNIEVATSLRTGSNEVFLDVNLTMLTFFPSGCEQYISLCKEAGIPLEVWTIDDEATIKNLDPYITGVTSNSLRYDLYKKTASIDEPVPESIMDVPMSEIIAGGVKYKLDNDKYTATVAAVEEKSLKEITIPATLKIFKRTYKVTAIANNALKALKKLTKVTIGKYVEEIGKYAFWNCGKLKTVLFKGTKVSKIGAKAFYNIPDSATFQCPGKKLKTYTKMIKAAGAPEGTSYVGKQ